MSTWRILEWSREHARGAITSPHFPRLEFDAACADVDDFTPGELVHVQVDGAGGSTRVLRIWPDLPRFRPPAGAPGALARAPALDEGVRVGAQADIAGASGWTDARVRFMPGCVRLELDDDNFGYGSSAALEFFDPSYIELPAQLVVNHLQLADGAAREYLASRIELSTADIAVAIIDEEGRFYFVVTRRLSFNRRA